jgi:uncharacterized membrane protein
VNPLLGIGCKVVSALAFTLMSAGIKYLGSDYPIGEIVFFRSAFAILPLLVWLAWQGDLLGSIRTTNLRGHVLRGIIGSCGMFSGFVALSYLSLSEATAIGYVSPLVTVMLASILLHEQVRVYRWTAVAVGFLGFSSCWLRTFEVGLSGAEARRHGDRRPVRHPGRVLRGGRDHSGSANDRHRENRRHRLYFSLLSSLLGLFTIVLGWRMPDVTDFALLVIIGIFGGVGQILLTQSYRYAGRVAGGPLRLHDNDLGGPDRLFRVRSAAPDGRSRRWLHRGRGRAVRDLARASPRPGAREARRNGSQRQT